MRRLALHTASHWNGSSYSRTRAWRRSVCQAGRRHFSTGSDDHHFYNYTSGRWLLTQRFLRFDVDALCTIIAGSVDQRSDDMVTFIKYAEGGSYRVFEATFKSGLKVIARLPYPCTVPRKYGTASEAATMTFLRLHGIPIPNVLAWSDTSVNPVGSEYIIMERVQGKELDEIWYTMSVKERMDVIEKIVDLERILFAIELPASGSLYFERSLDDGIHRVRVGTPPNAKETPTFCVGPSTEYLWWYQNRNELGVSCGPWESTPDVLKAVGEREFAWLQKFGTPRYPREPLYREFYSGKMVQPESQMRNLAEYLKVVSFMAPQAPELNRPCIRHPDLSPNNIFVSEAGEITGVIDWQHSASLPTFLQAKIPKHFQNYGDEDSEEFNPPRLPDDFDSLPEIEKDAATEVYRRRQVHYFYVGYTSHFNPSNFNAMGSHDLVMRNRLYDAAGRPWEGDITSLKAELIRFSKLGHKIGSQSQGRPEVPTSYSEAETADCFAIDEKQRAADAKMQALRDYIGINIDGWISNDLYEEAVTKEQHIREQIIGATETKEEQRDVEENWPFRDHEEID